MQALDDIIHDIHGLHQELSRCEQRYHLLSADFYHLYKTGELEQTRDMIEWVGYYEAKLERENQYRIRDMGRCQALAECLAPERNSTYAVEPSHATALQRKGHHFYE